MDQEDFIEYQRRLNRFSEMFDATNRCINADIRKIEKRFNDLEKQRLMMNLICGAIVIGYVLYDLILTK